jgi:ubiquinone biosynthesis protein UbiJ
VIGSVLRALKLALRRSLRWYLAPVTTQVTAHNQAVVEVLAEHSRQIVELRREVDRLRRRVAALEAEAGEAQVRRPA